MPQRRRHNGRAGLVEEKDRIHVCVPMRLRRALRAACDKHFSTEADYIRRALVIALRADGIEIERNGNQASTQWLVASPAPDETVAAPASGRRSGNGGVAPPRRQG